MAVVVHRRIVYFCISLCYTQYIYKICIHFTDSFYLQYLLKILIKNLQVFFQFNFYLIQTIYLIFKQFVENFV